MAESSSEVVLTERRDHVLLVTLNRPDVRNAVDLAVTRGLGRALEAAEHDRDVWIVVLTGAGDKAFCAGADLKAAARDELTIQTEGPEAAWGFAGYVRHHIAKPTIAAVNGYALGGGAELALASDLVVASETAVFGLPEVKRGVHAGGGGAFRLPWYLPRKIAMELILTGDDLPARRALELGLVNRVVPPEKLLDAALELAQRICANAPLAVQASKRVAYGIVDGEVATEELYWELSAAARDRLLETEDGREGIRAFTEKRLPVWRAR